MPSLIAQYTTEFPILLPRNGPYDPADLQLAEKLTPKVFDWLIFAGDTGQKLPDHLLVLISKLGNHAGIAAFHRGELNQGAQLLTKVIELTTDREEIKFRLIEAQAHYFKAFILRAAGRLVSAYCEDRTVLQIMDELIKTIAASKRSLPTATWALGINQLNIGIYESLAEDFLCRAKKLSDHSELAKSYFQRAYEFIELAIMYCDGKDEFSKKHLITLTGRSKYGATRARLQSLSEKIWDFETRLVGISRPTRQRAHPLRRDLIAG